MGFSTIVAAVASRLEANWHHCPVRGPNAGGNSDGGSGDAPAEGAAFLEFMFPILNSARISFGSPGQNLYRDEGAIRLVLNVASGRALEEAGPWIDELRDLFRGKSFDGVRTFAPSPPVLNDDNDRGGYFLLSFAVPFEHDYLG